MVYIPCLKKAIWHDLRGHLREPTPDRLWYIADAFRQNLSLEEIHLESRVDPWFLAQIEELVASGAFCIWQNLFTKLMKQLYVY